MKAAKLKGPGEVVLEEVPVPEISDDDVLAEVKYCGICGSDVHAVKYGLFPVGTYLGHEFSGVLTKIGKSVKGWRPGDRVVVNPQYRCGKCYACEHGRQSICELAFARTIGNFPGSPGAFAKFVRVPIPEWRLHALPDEISFEEGALVEPLANPLHAIRISDFRPRDRTMVLGAGPIGLGAIAHLKNAGAGLVIATEINEKRAELAKKLGADYVFDPQKVPNLKEIVLEMTNGRGVDIVFDCSGIPEAFLSATNFLRRGGQLMLVGVIEREVPIVPWDFLVNEWQLQGSFGYYSDEFPMVIDFLKRDVSPVREMISSKIKLSEIVEQGFNKLLKALHDEVKILVSPE